MSENNRIFKRGIIGICILIIIFCLEGNSSALSKKSPITTEKNLFLSQTNKTLRESPDIVFLSENSIKASIPSTIIHPRIAASLAMEEKKEIRKEIVEYIVEQNDTLSSIAQKFNISVDTIKWANNLESLNIKLGQKLIIPPVNGVIHYVGENDTLDKIAQKYQAEKQKIIEFNELESENLYINDILIVPDGKIKKPEIVPTFPAFSPLPKNYFICPIPEPCRITQGLHYFNAVDLSNGKCGDPVYATADGTVIASRTTESTSKNIFGGAGNHVKILHKNGSITFYAHLLTVSVKTGQEVKMGDTIGLVGGMPGMPGSGNSTGCHLHFSVFGAQNPFAYPNP